MKAALFVATLVLAPLAHADCVLTSDAHKTVTELEVRGCESDPTSLCVYATSIAGETIADQQFAISCLPGGSACAFGGEKFDLTYYQSRSPWSEPQPGFAYIRSAGSSTVLAKCQF